MSLLGHRLPKCSACQFVFIKQQASLINTGETVRFLFSNVPLRAIQSDWTVVTESGETLSNQW